ncbi:uncharacterized protein J3R85_009323 [Psidium guajava]|nr:uncharacterized protein J3R85_009323 [Psidium guajava]
MLAWAMTALKKNPGVMNKAQQEVRSSVRKQRFHGRRRSPWPAVSQSRGQGNAETLPASSIAGPQRNDPRLHTKRLRGKTQNPILHQRVGHRERRRVLAKRRGVLAREVPGERCGDVDFSGQSFELMPFGGGRRVCPGVGLAAVTLELALANLLYSFDWELPEGMEADDVDA